MRDFVSKRPADAGAGPGYLALERLDSICWRRVLTEAGLLLGFALASSWLVCR